MAQARSQNLANSFVCPITGKTTPIVRGVPLSNGCMYSKSGLKQAVKHQNYFPSILPGSNQPLVQADIRTVRSAISDAGKAAAIGFLVGTAITFVILTALFIATLPISAPASFIFWSLAKAAIFSGLSGLVGAGFAWVVDQMVESFTIPDTFVPGAGVNYVNVNSVPGSTFYVSSGLGYNYGYSPTYVSPVYVPSSNPAGYQSTGSSVPMSMPSSNPGNYHSTGSHVPSSMPSSNPGGYHSSASSAPSGMPSMPSSNAGNYHSSASVGGHRI